MGAKAWMLVYAATASTPVDALRHARTLDREATLKLATALFPKDKLEPIGDGSLAHAGPPGNEIVIGCFPGVSIVAAKEFAIDHPSKLAAQGLSEGSASCPAQDLLRQVGCELGQVAGRLGVHIFLTLHATRHGTRKVC